MSATAANLVDYVMPKVPLRQWVLTLPFAWRARLGFDGPLLGAVVRNFADAVLAFYKRRLAEEYGMQGQSGAVLVMQRTSSDLRLNPHVRAIDLDSTRAEYRMTAASVHLAEGRDRKHLAIASELASDRTDIAGLCAALTERVARLR
jgi:hypothetical protein